MSLAVTCQFVWWGYPWDFHFLLFTSVYNFLPFKRELSMVTLVFVYSSFLLLLCLCLGLFGTPLSWLMLVWASFSSRWGPPAWVGVRAGVCPFWWNPSWSCVYWVWITSYKFINFLTYLLFRSPHYSSHLKTHHHKTVNSFPPLSVAAVSCSWITAMLDGVRLGLGLTGKLGPSLAEIHQAPLSQFSLLA